MMISFLFAEIYCIRNNLLQIFSGVKMHAITECYVK